MRDKLMEEEQRQKRLTKALLPIGRGETIDGEPLDFAMIATSTHAEASAYAHQMALGQAVTANCQINRRYKG